MVALFAQSNIIDFPSTETVQKSSEWYTPARYIEAAREVMGSIALDPASCKEANQTVRAARFYTKEDNGLQQEWKASTVWCNPPFSATPDVPCPLPTWSQKMISEYQVGHFEQGIFLAKAETKNPWFHYLFPYLVCLSVHRIKFERPGREPQEIREGVAFVYFGKNEQAFSDTFAQFGTVVKRVSASYQKPHDTTLWDSIGDNSSSGTPSGSSGGNSESGGTYLKCRWRR